MTTRQPTAGAARRLRRTDGTPAIDATDGIDVAGATLAIPSAPLSRLCRPAPEPH